MWHKLWKKSLENSLCQAEWTLSDSSRCVQNSVFLHNSVKGYKKIQNKRSPIQFIKKCERCQTCKLSDWLLHLREWCLSLSQIPQALINQDLNTPFDPVIVSLRRTAKLNGKIWFLHSREDYKADATSITLKHSKHICNKEHLGGNLSVPIEFHKYISYFICTCLTLDPPKNTCRHLTYSKTCHVA